MFNIREVIQADAVEWLRSSDALFPGSVFTGIPDISDIPEIKQIKDTKVKTERYIEWFKSVVELILGRLADGQYCIFSQTDAKLIDKHGCLISWIDKSHLCSTVADLHNCTLCWHKIAVNTELSDSDAKSSNASASQYRPAYTHILCYGKRITTTPYRAGLFLTSDVINRGSMLWEKATGIDACILGIAFLINVVQCEEVLNLFCGHGTILAVANYFHLKAVGVEILPSRVKKSLALTCGAYVDSISENHLRELGITVCNLSKSNRQNKQPSVATSATTVSATSAINANTSTTGTTMNVTNRSRHKGSKAAVQSALRRSLCKDKRWPVIIAEGTDTTSSSLSSTYQSTLPSVDVLKLAEQSSWSKCMYFNVKKHRFCNLDRARGLHFCGIHCLEALPVQNTAIRDVFNNPDLMTIIATMLSEGSVLPFALTNHACYQALVRTNTALESEFKEFVSSIELLTWAWVHGANSEKLLVAAARMGQFKTLESVYERRTFTLSCGVYEAALEAQQFKTADLLFDIVKMIWVNEFEECHNCLFLDAIKTLDYELAQWLYLKGISSRINMQLLYSEAVWTGNLDRLKLLLSLQRKHPCLLSEEHILDAVSQEHESILDWLASLDLPTGVLWPTVERLMEQRPNASVRAQTLLKQYAGHM